MCEGLGEEKMGCEQQMTGAPAELWPSKGGEGGCGPLSGVDRGQGAQLRQQLGVGVQAGQAALLQGDGLS